ncbi:Imm53 family immunity protein [Frigidibacter oleivorans]|uniref:Imm53 family immunity protein n=1 Tax=Frigidibacter oleivorans TaxID=2487129 RepID=UPI000F8E454E|nr:Imm53 family immunity protein [Frigidibacter oleivorans]
MDIIDLENWLKSRCNGDWEHQGSISIESTDNPGWHIKVDFDTEEISDDHFVLAKSIYRSEADYVFFKYDRKENTLEISCGVHNLTEALTFLLV